MSQYRVRFSRSASGTQRYHVEDMAGRQHGGFFAHRALAETKVEQLVRSERKRIRPCITCGATFHSEGPGNRMCPTCRTSKSEVWGASHVVPQ